MQEETGPCVVCGKMTTRHCPYECFWGMCGHWLCSDCWYVEGERGHRHVKKEETMNQNNSSLWFVKEGEYMEIKLTNNICTKGLLGCAGLDRYHVIEHMNELGWDLDEE